MMEKELLVDTFNVKVESNWNINEASEDSVVDGVSVLGRVSGPFFVTNASTENNRFYPKSLWENVISRKNELISNGLMFGTIGHKQPLDDQAILEGKASHRVSKLWIDEDGKGFGEILILNTPSGRVLNTIIRSGAKFPVSSRGYGEYKGKTSEGKRIVNPDTYDLVGFDFVRIPGVTTAIPQLVENSNDDENLTTEFAVGEEIDTMSDHLAKVIENLTEEKTQLRIKLDQVLDTNRQLTEKLTKIEEENPRAAMDSMREALHEAEKIAIEYRMLGTPEEISEAFNAIESHVSKTKLMTESSNSEITEELNKYRGYGSVEEVETAINGAIDLLSMYEKLGSPQGLESQLNETNTLLESYKELGTPEEINRALSILEEFSTEVGSLGDTVEALDKSAALLEQYIELGSPTEIAEAFELIEKHMSEASQKEFDTKVEEVAEELGVHREVVASMIKTHGTEQGIEMIKTIRESNGISTRYRKSLTEEFAPEEAVSKVSMNESRSARLLDTFSR